MLGNVCYYVFTVTSETRKDRQMEIILDNSWASVSFNEVEIESGFSKVALKAIDDKLKVRQKGYMFNPAFKGGHWDGFISFYDFKENRYPTGLTSKVEEALGELQTQYPFTYEIIDDRPDVIINPEDVPDEVILYDDEIDEISLRDYQMKAYKSALQNRMSVLHLATAAGKTVVAAGVIKTLLPELYAGETIAFFTESTEIFNQTARVLEERLGIKVGKYGAGKKDIRDVNVVMVPTISAALKIDPEKGLRFNAKEMVVKKMAKEIAPQYLKGVNQRSLLKIFMHNFEVKTKADERLLQELDKVVYESGTDAEVKMKLNGYVVEYEKLVEKKNGKKLKKKKEVIDFLHSIVAFISDEHHHVVADSTYDTLLNCENAIYRIGLTGSIDYEDHLLTQRMWATTGAVTARVTTKELVDLGFVAQPKIVMAPIYTTKVNQQNIDITALKDYQKAYDLGIMQNEYRNELIAGIAKMRYDDDMGVLIIVSRIEHGDSISELLDGYEVPHVFLQGEVDGDTRTEKLQEMRDGDLKVMIATTIMDEGVDISGIDVLLMAAGGKSLRQTIQRVGRAIRKKKGRENTAYVYDFYDRTNEYLFKHSKERLKIYEEEEFEINYIE